MKKRCAPRPILLRPGKGVFAETVDNIGACGGYLSKERIGLLGGAAAAGSSGAQLGHRHCATGPGSVQATNPGASAWRRRCALRWVSCGVKLRRKRETGEPWHDVPRQVGTSYLGNGDRYRSLGRGSLGFGVQIFRVRRSGSRGPARRGIRSVGRAGGEARAVRRLRLGYVGRVGRLAACLAVGRRSRRWSQKVLFDSLRSIEIRKVIGYDLFV